MPEWHACSEEFGRHLPDTGCPARSGPAHASLPSQCWPYLRNAADYLTARLARGLRIRERFNVMPARALLAVRRRPSCPECSGAAYTERPCQCRHHLLSADCRATPTSGRRGDAILPCHVLYTYGQAARLARTGAAHPGLPCGAVCYEPTTMLPGSLGL